MIAFVNNEKFCKSNTQVVSGFQVTRLFLHGNEIARKGYGATENDTGTTFTLASWPSVTTRERLRGLGILVSQQKGIQYLTKCEGGIAQSIEIEDDKWYDLDGNAV